MSHIGACGIWCGRNHCLVQTLDGRVFGWGLNTSQQLLVSDEVTVQATPVLCGRAKSVAAGSNFSLLLDSSGSLINSDRYLRLSISNLFVLFFSDYPVN